MKSHILLAAIALATARPLTACTQETQNRIGRAVQNWTGTDGVLEIYAGDKLVRRFMKIDKLTTGKGTQDDTPRAYRFGYGIMDEDLDGVPDGMPAEEALDPASQVYARWTLHGVRHMLGLDVHDPGDYARGDVPRALEPGMVFTVEPGLYFRPGVAVDGAEPFSGIGIRIEDDVLVTRDKPQVLTKAAPKRIEEVEALVGSA